MHFSYWETRGFLKNIDALVVGGGIVGLSTAIFLRRSHPSMRVVVVEKDAFSGGASTRNAGFACFGSAGELLDDLGTMPAEDVFDLVERRYRGLALLRDLLGDGAIGYQACGGYELFRSTDGEFERCADALEMLNREVGRRIGRACYRTLLPEDVPLRLPSVRHAILNDAEGAIDTGRMMFSLRQLALREGVELFTGLHVASLVLDGNGAVVDFGGYACRIPRVFVCTNSLAARLLPALEVWPARNQVIVTQPHPALDFAGTYHMERGFVYFRSVDGRLLIGGCRHLDPEGENTAQHGFSDTIQEALQALIGELFPGIPVETDMRWSGFLGLGPVKRTIVEEVSPGVWAGVRMGGMGVALGTGVGRQLAAMATQ